MTGSRRDKKDKKSGGKNPVRSKNRDAFGTKYDTRKGHWTALDKAVLKEGRLLDTWLKPERVAAELEILNPPGKIGRPYEYPPSLILYLSYLKEDGGRSYRRAVSRTSVLLEAQGLPEPNYSTLHKSQLKFESGGFGLRVISEATVILAGRGVTEEFDPLRIIGSGIFPDYEAPQMILTSQAEAELQAERDREAEKIRRSMEVKVLKSALGGEDISVAVDGSGEGISGPGIYLEHIWLTNNRRFIKQHTMIDLRTKKVVAFATTMEKPGDARMMAPLVSGAIQVGVRLKWVSADSAYDTVTNWEFMDSTGIAFCPNLKEKFEDCGKLLRREALQDLDRYFGKELAHRITGYNLRWLVEAFFSVFKKLFGDRVANRLFERMCLTMQYRYSLYDIHREIMLEA